MLYEFGSYVTGSEGNHVWPSAMNSCDSLKIPNVKVVSKSISVVVYHSLLHVLESLSSTLVFLDRLS
jgi:hypothetical protein